MTASLRYLIVVLGDQLNRDSAAFEGFDRTLDAVWMAEVIGESQYVWSSKMRTAVFLSAMRHFAQDLRKDKIAVHYRELDETRTSLAAALGATLSTLKPKRVVMVQAGEWRLHRELGTLCAQLGIPLEFREDKHFLCTADEFNQHASQRKQLRLEFFYRDMRCRHGILMEERNGKAVPAGGRWNFDHDNRKSFGKSGPPCHPRPLTIEPDVITQQVIELINRVLSDHPGNTDGFGWAVTREDALATLDDFVEYRLTAFGAYQDAMWTEEPWLFHSRLSSALNVKLLHPREVIAAAERAYQEQHVPLASVEGFIRQVLGWREYVRGIYWREMPQYLESNALNATEALPLFYWTGACEMRCLQQSIGQTLKYGYAHHIQRLMVTGLYALLLGVNPRSVHEWYLAVYVDAVEWVELPNSLGMSQYADDGLMASKPYVASGKYIQRMSNYCTGCRYDPARATGARACPFTTLYWDFLIRHETLLKKNQRMALQVKNSARLTAGEKLSITEQAQTIRANGGSPIYV